MEDFGEHLQAAQMLKATLKNTGQSINLHVTQVVCPIENRYQIIIAIVRGF